MNKYNQIGEVLRNPENRCRGRAAEDFNGSSVSAYHSGAYRWCLLGALCKVAPHIDSSDCMFILSEILGYREATSLYQVWDDATDEEQDQIVNRLLSYNGVLDYRRDDYLT